jgi:glycine betaine/choline ABC-type transport system substrate-binding protein
MSHIKFNTMETLDKFKQALLAIDSGEFNESMKVSILELIAERIGLNTISEMARIEGKTPRGINISNQYKKIQIGKQTLCYK